jgi:hypothetical protein
VRILVEAPFRFRDPDQIQELDRPLARLVRRCVPVRVDRLRELLAHLVEGMQRGQRVLEDHSDLVAAHAPELLRRQRGEIATVEHDPARDARVLRAGEAEDRQVGNALAAPRFADDPERLATSDAERRTGDGAQWAVVGLERDLEVLDREQRRGAHWYRTLGSRKA